MESTHSQFAFRIAPSHGETRHSDLSDRALANWEHHLVAYAKFSIKATCFPLATSVGASVIAC